MITLEREITDKFEIKDIRDSILAMGCQELNLWKKAIATDEKLFNLLFQFVFSEDQRLAWRSCWIIDNASEDDPILLKGKIQHIIAGLLVTKNSSLKRHFTRILCRSKLPHTDLGLIIDRCYELIKPTEPIAVRVFALQLLFNITLLEPDLKEELISVIECLREEGGSAGFMNRSGKLLQKLKS